MKTFRKLTLALAAIGLVSVGYISLAKPANAEVVVVCKVENGQKWCTSQEIGPGLSF
jgi:hypothetical protein